MILLSRLRAWRSGLRIPLRTRNFSFPKRPDRLWGPPTLLFNEYRYSFPRGKTAEVNHRYPSTAEVKNEWIYTSSPLIRLPGIDLEHFTYNFTRICCNRRHQNLQHWRSYGFPFVTAQVSKRFLHLKACHSDSVTTLKLRRWRSKTRLLWGVNGRSCIIWHDYPWQLVNEKPRKVMPTAYKIG